MRISCNVNELLDSLKLLKLLVKSPSFPILENVLVRADTVDGQMLIDISATNLQIFTTFNISGKVFEGGRVLINLDHLFKIATQAKKMSVAFINIFSKLIDDPVTLEPIDEVSIEVAELSYFETSSPANNYVEEFLFNGFPETVHITASNFIKAIRQTIYAASSDLRKPALTHVNLRFIDKNTVMLTALDGHRLAISKCSLLAPLNNKINSNQDFLIPYGALNILNKFKFGKHEMIQINVCADLIRFKVAAISIRSKLSTESFPDTEKLIKKHSRDFTGKFKVKSLLSSVEALAINLTKDSLIGMMFNLAENKLTLFDPIKETSQLTLNCEFIKEADRAEEGIEIGIDPKYLIQALKTLDGDIDIYFQDWRTPVIIKSLIDETVCLIMPVEIRR